MNQIIAYTHARHNLSALMDAVLDNNEVVAITRGNRPPVVMMSLEDFKGYEETAHILSTEASRAALRKIKALIKDAARTPHEGLGKPEPLKHNLSGLWSRRIDREHRLVYAVEGGALVIVQCRFRY